MTNLISLLINCSVLSFPVLVNLVEHAGSAFLVIFTLTGLRALVSQPDDPVLLPVDKRVMACFATYFFVTFLFFLGHGFFNDAIALKWKLDHEIRMLAFIPIYYTFLRYGTRSCAFWFGISGGAIVAGIYALIFIYVSKNGARATGAYHAIAFGDLSLAMGFISLTGYRYFQYKHRWLITLPILSFIIGVMATFLSATRGAVIAIPAMSVLLLIQAGRHPKAKLFQAATGIILVAAIWGAYMLPASIMDSRIHQGFHQVTSFFHGTDSPRDAPRLKMWAESLKIIKENPITGVGHGGYEPIIQKRAEKNPKLNGIKNHGSPHNMYITNMVEYGISGLFILMAIFIAPLLIFIPAATRSAPTRDFGYAGIMVVIAFAHFAVTESIFNRSVFIAFYLMTTAILLSLCRKSTY